MTVRDPRSSNLEGSEDSCDEHAPVPTSPCQPESLVHLTIVHLASNHQ